MLKMKSMKGSPYASNSNMRGKVAEGEAQSERIAVACSSMKRMVVR